MSALHQASGMKATKQFRESIGAEMACMSVELEKLLALLCPRSSKPDYGKAIVERAFNLKMDMMTEKNLYDCFWVDYGQELKQEAMDCGDDNARGSVLMCEFPGLIRTVKSGIGAKKIVLAKALIRV